MSATEASGTGTTGEIDPAFAPGVERVRRRSMRLLDRVLPRLDLPAADADLPPDPDAVVHHWKHSNDLLEIRLGERRLMLKRGVESWSGRRFLSSRIAAARLREAGIEAPLHLEVAERMDEDPVLAWWRVPGPTLAGAWPRLGPAERRRALVSLGGLLRRIHEIPATGWGPLWRERSAEGVPVHATAADFLRADLLERLRPALGGEAPGAMDILEGLVVRIGDLPLQDEAPVLVHNDPHFSNILCDEDVDGVRCVGVLDLEAAAGGAPESDVAWLATIHSPLLAGRPETADPEADPEAWETHVETGYGRTLRSKVVSFFRVYHLLNVGFHAALTGRHEHAGAVFAAARAVAGAPSDEGEGADRYGGG